MKVSPFFFSFKHLFLSTFISVNIDCLLYMFNCSWHLSFSYLYCISISGFCFWNLYSITRRGIVDSITRVPKVPVPSSELVPPPSLPSKRVSLPPWTQRGGATFSCRWGGVGTHSVDWIESLALYILCDHYTCNVLYSTTFKLGHETVQ